MAMGLDPLVAAERPGVIMKQETVGPKKDPDSSISKIGKHNLGDVWQFVGLFLWKYV